MQPELERGDDAEVAPAAADRPEQVGVPVVRRTQHPAVGGDHFGGGQVVDGQAELARQPPHAAAQRQPPDAGMADQPGRDGQPMGLGSGVQVSQQRPAADPCAPGSRVDRHCVELAQVDHDAVVADGRARAVVSAAAYGYLQLVLAGEAKRLDHVRRRRTAGDQRRTTIDSRVPDPAAVIEIRVARLDDGSVHRPAQFLDPAACRVRHDRLFSVSPGHAGIFGTPSQPAAAARDSATTARAGPPSPQPTSAACRAAAEPVEIA